MENDFPAAHSMDSSWYAIDKNGQVALFITGAGGAMPNNAYSPEGAADMDELDEETLEELGYDREENNIPEDQLPPREHLFVYETGMHDESLADRYERSQAPKQPMHVDQLPPQVRDAVKKVCFETLDFSQTKIFQPVELTDCGSWDPAYLSNDGKTVKPVPGREDEYADFLKERRDEMEDGTITFEEPKPKKKKGKKKGGKDGS